MPAPVRRTVSNPLDLENLRESGITDETIQANGLYSDGRGLVFHYRNLDGKPNGFERWRHRTPQDDDRKYSQKRAPADKKGSNARAYFPVASLPKLKSVKNPLYITEGEKKALALSQCGYAAVGIGGIWNGVKDKIHLIDDLKSIPLKGRTVYIVFDCDEKPKTQRDVHAAKNRLANVLKAAGAGEILDVELPPGPDGKKQGADDFLVAHSKEAFQELVDQAASLFEDIDGESATMADAAQVVEGIEYLIPSWIPLGMVTGLVAQPGIGKSAFALHEIVRPIVTGQCWFTGKRTIAYPGKVLWCDTENGMAITIDRMKKWKTPMDRVRLPFPDPLKAVDLSNTSHLEQVEKLIVRYQIRAAIIDSLRGAHDGDENNSRVGRVLQNLAGIAERTGCAVIVIHHTKKLMDDEEITANSSRGSNAILAMMRSQIGIDRPDPSSKRCRVRVLKENLGIAPEPVGFEITKKGIVFGEAPQKQKRRTRRDDAQEFLLRNMTPGQWHKASELIELAEQEGISEDALHQAKKAMGFMKPHSLRKGTDCWEWQLPGASQKQDRRGKS